MTMATFHFDLVSPEKLAFSGEVDQVDVPGIEGDFGVLAGHAPVVAVIRPGILTVTSGGTQQKIIVLGGLAEVSDKGLTVLADVATSVQDLDRTQFADTISEHGRKAGREGGLRTRPRDRAARSLQEHPAAAQFDGDALGSDSGSESDPSVSSPSSTPVAIAPFVAGRMSQPMAARIPQTPAPPSGTPRAGTAPRDRRRHRVVPSATGRIPPAGRCAASADRCRRRRPRKRSANHFWRWPRNFASRCGGPS